jgi:hypothetical protein
MLEKAIIKPVAKKKKRHIVVNSIPFNLIQIALLKGEYKICDRGYRYIEWQEYKEYLHRIIVRYNKREIPKGYTIHHKDRNKLNNDNDNLEVLTWEEHRNRHH